MYVSGGSVTIKESRASRYGGSGGEWVAFLVLKNRRTSLFSFCNLCLDTTTFCFFCFCPRLIIHGGHGTDVIRKFVRPVTLESGGRIIKGSRPWPAPQKFRFSGFGFRGLRVNRV